MSHPCPLWPYYKLCTRPFTVDPPSGNWVCDCALLLIKMLPLITFLLSPYIGSFTFNHSIIKPLTALLILLPHLSWKLDRFWLLLSCLTSYLRPKQIISNLRHKLCRTSTCCIFWMNSHFLLNRNFLTIFFWFLCIRPCILTSFTVRTSRDFGRVSLSRVWSRFGNPLSKGAVCYATKPINVCTTP